MAYLKFSAKSVHSFITYSVYKNANKQTDRKTNSQVGNIMPRTSSDRQRHKYKCVSKMHIRQTRGVQLKLRATPRPLFKGNISVSDCMPLSSLLKTIKINGSIECIARGVRRISSHVITIWKSMSQQPCRAP